ncbi:MAG: hypothetical protein HY303_00905 [Candidatus Wallbacteria bacterium]|nr:hypothetical protein [Candidatus Wallbacteria bacterium]
MKQRTLEVLARVQAVREAAARRRLNAAAAATEASRTEAARLAEEEKQVRRQYEPGAAGVDPWLEHHASRYADVLRVRERAAAEMLEKLEAEREAARLRIEKLLVKADAIERKRREQGRG